MAIVLTRIDSRLIHGQVLEAWVPHVKADCIVVANDAVAHTPLQRMIMQAAVPSDLRLVIGTLEEVAALLVSTELSKYRTLLLFASSDDALRACRLGIDYAKLNLGNMHGAEGKDRYSCTIALDQRDIGNLREVAACGVVIVSQCVPADRELGWQSLVRNGMRQHGAHDYLATGTLAILLGLDRMAFLQCMVSRPLVAAPLAGWMLGVPLSGLQVGMLSELLWLGRLPVGTVIPPDDTQMAIGATALVLTVERLLGLHGMPAVILCVLVAIPLGQIGQYADSWARRANDKLARRAETAAAAADARRIEWLHLRGSAHFALAGLGTCAVIIAVGTPILWLLTPLLIGAVRETGLGLQYSFTLIGTAVLLGTLNVRRGLVLFGVAFTATLLVLWLR